NAFIYYNRLILSEVLAELKMRGATSAAEVLKRISPIAWQRINFYGRYRFHAHASTIDIKQLSQNLAGTEIRDAASVLIHQCPFSAVWAKTPFKMTLHGLSAGRI
ncbi:MAG: Tn3 family transposase, partial [Pseudomonadota bacterium]